MLGARRLAVLFLALAAAVPLFVSATQAAAGQPAPPPLPANATVVASGLINPRGFTFAPDGALFVVEISRFVGRPPFLEPFTGRVARAGEGGQLTTVAGNLMFPTIARFGPDGRRAVATVVPGLWSGREPRDQGRRYGISSTFPVVWRPVSAWWAWAAWSSGRVRSIRTRSLSAAIQPSTSSARWSSSWRVCV
jgi:hypothetical protein